jgi:phage-related protein
LRIEFFPPAGKRHSPFDYISNLSNNAQRAQIVHRLDTLKKLEIGDWPHTWIHKIRGAIYQLTAGDHRIMFCLDNKTIVVLHICRKVKQKTRRKDIKRAEIHYNEYVTQKKG